MVRRKVLAGNDRLRRDQKKLKRSVAMVWTAVTTTVMLGFAAFSVDMGYMYVAQSELQCSADAAAMAAASQIVDAGNSSPEAVLAIAKTYAGKNKVAGRSPTLDSSDIVYGHASIQSNGKTTFEADVKPYDAVKVTVRMTKDSPNGNIKLFFAPILGVESTDLSASSVAMLVPRDIAIVIDLSNSMSYDSQLRHEHTTNINIKEVWEALGSPTFGKMTTFHDNANQMTYNSSKSVNEIIQALGLKYVPYPYPVGSWKDYIDYVMYKGNGSTADGGKTIADGASEYSSKYGLRTWVNYLMDCRHLTSDTPALKDCPVQPVTAMKDAVVELCNYLIMMDSGDLVSLIAYSNTASVEQELTPNYLNVIEVTKSQQAGSQGNSTNIANGIERARQELTSSRARDTAKKVMIVLTDGMANLPDNERTGKLRAANAGHSAVSQNIQIYTISLGSQSDQELMAELAEMGKGIHYHVPTNDIEQYKEDLKKVFRTLGGKRPIRLIG